MCTQGGKGEKWRNSSPSEIFTACDQQLHCKFGYRMCNSVAEGRCKDVFICSLQWLCDWNALACRVAQDFESAHQEIRGTIQSPPGNNSKLQHFWRRKFPLPKLSPLKLSPPPPCNDCLLFWCTISLCVHLRVCVRGGGVWHEVMVCVWLWVGCQQTRSTDLLAVLVVDKGSCKAEVCRQTSNCAELAPHCFSVGAEFSACGLLCSVGDSLLLHRRAQIKSATWG